MKTSEEALSKIVVNIFYIEDIPDPDFRYTAYILEGPYQLAVSSDSVPGLFKEISLSMQVIDNYKAKNE